MRLEYLCDLHIVLNESQAMIKPHDGEEGSLFALGEGTVAGERLRGTVRCANHARRRADGAMMPHITGVITTGDQASILFQMRGLTPWPQTPEGAIGDQISWIGFETDAANYRWLNDLRCVLEGAVHIDAALGADGQCRVYVCVNELV